ncbi:peptidase S8/S53 domain-containing protein [Stachybotrys elegans]|uniref:Peptidase S8/S53 domain-containing protein n=1 Tax=Stachybotrys elegans TaxID=80388 RepID=A0A8K0WV67_9HYPO|nr:peptidase S8/S53 domain-containing protein [Stachybotrys elegans]
MAVYLQLCLDLQLRVCNDNCGFGALIANVNDDRGCFSKAIDKTPLSGRPSEKPSAGGYRSMGCWTDSVDSRALLNGGSARADDMTVEKCADLARGFRYAGVEYSVECFWGNKISESSARANGQCDMPCGGSPFDVCGGGNLINIYEDSSLVPSPLTVPAVGSFGNVGCYEDSTASRVLVVDEESDFTFSGMTVDKCVKLAKDNGLRYAGVEYAGECFVGNTLHHEIRSPEGDCNLVCAGNTAQFCGNGNRIRVYEDSAWRDPTLDQLTFALTNYNTTLFRVRGLIEDYNTALKEWEAAPGVPSRRGLIKRLEPRVMRERLVKTYDEFVAEQEKLYRNARAAVVEFNRAASQDITRQRNPFVDSPTREQAIEAFDIPLEPMGQVRESMEADLETLASTTSETPLLDTGRGLSLSSSALSTIGIPRPILAGIPAGLGVFLTLAIIFSKLHPSVDEPNQPTQAPTSIRPATTTTTTTTTTTSSCSPVLSPTPMVVFMEKDTSDAEYKDLINSIPQERLIDESIAPEIGWRAFLARIDDCEAEEFESKSSVGSVSLNAMISTEEGSELETRGLNNELHKIPSLNETQNTRVLASRDVSPNTDLTYQNFAPRHLRWLSAPWAKTTGNLGGSYWDLDGYLFNSRPGRDVWIYIFDTGIWGFHSDFAEINGVTKLEEKKHLSGGSWGQGNHGTAMASFAAGHFIGVAKNAKLVDVQITDLRSGVVALWDYMRAFAYACREVRNMGRQTQAVFSMSWGFNFRDLNWREARGDKPTVPLGPRRYDPFPRIFSQYTWPLGVVTVSAASNNGNDDMGTQCPTAAGGRDTGLIVVGNANMEGRNAGSSERDSSGNGILTLYAMGHDVCGAEPYYSEGCLVKSGASPATAQVAGLAAYYLADPQARTDIFGSPDPGENSWPQVSLMMKRYLENIGTRAKGTAWARGIPRAALDEQLACQVAAPDQITPLTDSHPDSGTLIQYDDDEKWSEYSVLYDQLADGPELNLMRVRESVSVGNTRDAAFQATLGNGRRQCVRLELAVEEGQTGGS